jgi:sugar/nucleoside kinase (ribokinase family)
MIVADSQTSSQIGTFRFKDAADYPTEHEARRNARQQFRPGGARRGVAPRRGQLFITLAPGAADHARASSRTSTSLTVPAFNTAPKDVSGAGDSLLTCSSLALAVGANIWQCAYLGSIAAACQVSRVGNSPLSADELVTELCF